MQLWLTQIKYVPPRLRDDFVLRSRLLNSLRALFESQTLISTPADFGRTTLLASLLDKPVA